MMVERRFSGARRAEKAELLEVSEATVLPRLRGQRLGLIKSSPNVVARTFASKNG